MADYKVTASDTRQFNLLTNDQTVGVLEYPDWFSFKATMQLATKATYQVEPKSFWGTTIEVKDGPKVLLDFTMGWNGNILVHVKMTDTEQDFVFKSKEILKSTYALTDREKQELVVIQPDFNWNKLNYDYTLTTSDKFDRLENQAILLLTVVHCANYYINSMTTAALVAVL